MSELERLLRGDKQIQELRIQIWTDIIPIEEQHTWIEVNVERCKKLTLYNVSNVDLVEHLTFKYPTIEEIDLRASSGSTAKELFKTDIDRIFAVINHIQKKNAVLKIPLTMNAMEVIRY